jgi:hypothetical protein
LYPRSTLHKIVTPRSYQRRGILSSADFELHRVHTSSGDFEKRVRSVRDEAVQGRAEADLPRQAFHRHLT